MIGGPRTAGALRVLPPLAAVASRLPQWPHSVTLAAGLNFLLEPLLSEDARTALRGRVVSIRISDTAIDCRVRLTALGFVPVLARRAPDVSIRASVYDYWLLARRAEDPDTLFFARRLIMEGDTELGLVVKNALDAVEWSPASLLAALADLFHAARLIGAAGMCAVAFVEMRPRPLARDAFDSNQDQRYPSPSEKFCCPRRIADSTTELPKDPLPARNRHHDL